MPRRYHYTMKLAILLFLTIMTVLIHSSLLTYAGPWWLRPDLPMVLVLTWGLAFGGGQGILAAGLGGLLLDSLSAVPLGSHVLALIPAGLLGAARATDLFASRASLPFVLVPLATLGYYGTLTLLLIMGGRQVDLLNGVQSMAVALIVNAALSPLLFVLTSALALRYSEQFRTAVRL